MGMHDVGVWCASMRSASVYYMVVHGMIVPSMGMHDVGVWSASMRSAGM
jgi:hypothetical protein